MTLTCRKTHALALSHWENLKFCIIFGALTCAQCLPMLICSETKVSKLLRNERNPNRICT